MREYTEEYFQNKQEQVQISTAILKAIPENVFYHNLIIVLINLLQNMIMDSYKEAVFHSSHKAEGEGSDLRDAALSLLSVVSKYDSGAFPRDVLESIEDLEKVVFPGSEGEEKSS